MTGRRDDAARAPTSSASYYTSASGCAASPRRYLGVAGRGIVNENGPCPPGRVEYISTARHTIGMPRKN